MSLKYGPCFLSSSGKPSFNPIAETYLRKALQNILARAGVPSPGSEALELVITTANGDIRSAINALEFACGTSVGMGNKNGTKGKRKGHSSRWLCSISLAEYYTTNVSSNLFY
jgi:DNA polymerase III delta prime subunit